MNFLKTLRSQAYGTHFEKLQNYQFKLTGSTVQSLPYEASANLLILCIPVLPEWKA